ncbi:SAM-dependent methyltransferase [Paenibacillus sp. CAA11]|uniref:class I SAM-dependent methyltransferase n=1 Tax=Paenibacillus sp. CAA11 TaxID=1532905 RepID=UPI000D33A301|nr:class I SAM-dependent methyltransferase [Paenibacillus sp. CAA11]AWB43911.1 SAM-dependent methyltransferase [Paenibacillus sp. CAA11]
MGFLSVLSMAHRLISERLSPGDLAIDATAGTGADTLFLARCCGRRGKVYSFDIQSEALRLTAERLAKAAASEHALAEVALLERSHAEMKDALPQAAHGQIGGIMFNLGYLPAEGADAAIITVPDSTLTALNASLELLRPRGILTAVLYPGHPGGDQEAAQVERWASEIPGAAGQAIIYRQLQRPAAPYLVAIEKK